ncbi:hypothetical protein G436_0030 [Leptospira interrogans serovar Hardjo str. Norma]|uniref:Uncharacterized protein n=1 Tax=Leptospira interrogans serovar Hardjo str. Norma TaxID=1279460 RepID=A0A0M5L6S3_LEPIR|nr:hypothetical protein G436_0030 [Leptospira interrogans serovar Hardjo str. Norma]
MKKKILRFNRFQLLDKTGQKGTLKRREFSFSGLKIFSLK